VDTPQSTAVDTSQPTAVDTSQPTAVDTQNQTSILVDSEKAKAIPIIRLERIHVESRAITLITVDTRSRYHREKKYCDRH
jgi:hypothetical protein